MINSATAFPVELVYATHGGAMHQFGRIDSSLPRPDMIVTHTSWDVFVPTAPSYGKPDTNMEVLAGAVMASVADASVGLLSGAVANVINGEPLHIELPTQGLLFSFSKLYANQSSEDAHFSLRYVNSSAGFIGLWLSMLATLAVWVGIVLLGHKSDGSDGNSPGMEFKGGRDTSLLLGILNAGALPVYVPWLLIGAGSAVTVLAITLLSVSIIPPALLSLAIALALAGRMAWRRHSTTG